MRSEQDINNWEAILQSSLWDFPDNKSYVAPALRLSYYYLPSHLKRCFLTVRFSRRATDSERRMEDIGEDYLNQLLSRSFFTRKGNYVVMHDLMHDLSLAVSGKKFCARLEDGEKVPKISEKTRYFSYSMGLFDRFTKFEVLFTAKYLRSFITWESLAVIRHRGFGCYLSNKIPVIMIPQFYCLHVLSLPKYKVLKLPESIKNLKQLRYLDVSETGIQELPESVSTLCNLQTLLLSGCEYLKRLPADTSRLVSLRHLDISKTTSLEQMPKHMSKLTSLQTLGSFVVSKQYGQGIEELRELRLIRGNLSLRSLQNVSSTCDAVDANLSSREYINELALEFDNTDNDDSQREEQCWRI
ncbi:hypothetical protein RDABS01_034827 [Bienertia sinuspersici]